MAVITDPKINGYLMRLAEEDDPEVLTMEKIARERNFPIVDRLVGRLLFVITKLKAPGLVVELGSGFGYSAYWFARAMEHGKVVLTDLDEGNIEYAKGAFRRAGLLRRAGFHVGDAVTTAKKYGKIDILFVDIEKREYLDAVRTLMPNLNRHALVIADNTLWYGRVTEGKRDKETLGIKRFNRYMTEHEDFFTTILPLRDGVLMAYKLS